MRISDWSSVVCSSDRGQVSSASYAPKPYSIRRMVLSGTVRGSDPRARLIGRDAYMAAGGRSERELFDDDDSESWVDVALLESLAAAKMEEQAKALAAEQGLAWVKPTLDPYASYDLVEGLVRRSEEHTSELQSLMRSSYAVFCLTITKATEHDSEGHLIS